MKRSKKTVLIIAATVLVVLIALSNALSKKAVPPAEKNAPIPAQSTTPEAASLPPEASHSVPGNGDVSAMTQSPVDEEKTPYMKLSENEDAYLFFLRIIGTCYKDNSLTQEIFDEMAQYSDVQTLVEDVLNYRYQHGVLSPDLAASFSAFWTDDIASTHPEVTKALQVSFDLEYNLVQKMWILKENRDTIAAHAADSFEWLPATGHLYPGVELYIVTDTTTTFYGVITSLTDKDVEIYLTASNEAQWFGRRIPMISEVLKVRSDDPHLPKY